ncbi:hypothetical protein HN789_02795 [archaeon]|jgi:hypothetical protein|nr:hypothetical protein [archaeon]MBT4021986.1 hypothetical protein [archaeon]MBT4272302.1 hypothetical protein [archaeon]MBT4460838.1 hypothetical protein [archaeon]MBT4857897.1 hypothetical protein [archaeon]
MDSESDKLRRQINELNKDNERYGSNEDLAKSINSLIKIFAEASDDLKMDTHDAVLVTQKLDKIVERLERIEIQNEKIAKGIVAIADMVEDAEGINSLPRQSLRSSSKPSIPSSIPPSANQFNGTKPLPTLNMPREPEQKKKSFLNFKM